MWECESTAQNRDMFIANCKRLWDELARHVELHGTKEATIQGFSAGPVVPCGRTGLQIEIRMLTDEPKLRVIK